MKRAIRPTAIAVWIVPVLFIAALIRVPGWAPSFHGTALAQSHDVPRGQLVRRSLVGNLIGDPSGGSISIETPHGVVTVNISASTRVDAPPEKDVGIGALAAGQKVVVNLNRSPVRKGGGQEEPDGTATTATQGGDTGTQTSSTSTDQTNGGTATTTTDGSSATSSTGSSSGDETTNATTSAESGTGGTSTPNSTAGTATSTADTSGTAAPAVATVVPFRVVTATVIKILTPQGQDHEIARSRGVRWRQWRGPAGRFDLR